MSRGRRRASGGAHSVAGSGASGRSPHIHASPARTLLRKHLLQLRAQLALLGLGLRARAAAAQLINERARAQQQARASRRRGRRAAAAGGWRAPRGPRSALDRNPGRMHWQQGRAAPRRRRVGFPARAGSLPRLRNHSGRHPRRVAGGRGVGVGPRGPGGPGRLPAVHSARAGRLGRAARHRPQATEPAYAGRPRSGLPGPPRARPGRRRPPLRSTAQGARPVGPLAASPLS